MSINFSMKNIFSSFILLLSLNLIAESQVARDSVVMAVTDYVDAFYYGDTTKIHRSIVPNVYKYGYFRKKNATNYEGMEMTFREMIAYSEGARRGPLSGINNQPKKIELFEVQDQTACAKLTAWWGSDYILLAKIEGVWKITHVLWQSPPKKL